MIDIRENERAEFKREYTSDTKKTIVAFANSFGGRLYLGVEDDGTVVGIRDTDSEILKVANAVKNAIKPDLAPFVGYAVEQIKEKNVVVVDIQKGTAAPYYLEGKGIRPEGVYVRQGPSSIPASETMILRMIKETDGATYEAIRSIKQNLTFSEAEQEFSERGVAFGDAQKISLGLMKADGVYTNLGLLLSDQCAHSIKAARYEGIEKEVFEDRREFTGSVLKQVKEVYAYIDQNNHTNAKVEGLYRHDTRDYPTEAIRESLLNLVVHRDYAFSSPGLISLFDDRIEMVSVGGLVKGITREDILLGISIARNEKLANVFYRLGLIEAYGTGIPKILKSYSETGETPELITTDNAFKIVLPNLGATKSNLSFSEGSSNMDDREKAVFDFIESSGEVERRDVDKAFRISQTSSSRILKKLVNEGKLKIKKEGKLVKYIKA